MTTKQYLGQLAILECKINNKLSEIYQLKALACGVTVSTEKEKILMSSDKDKLGSVVAKICDTESEVSEQIHSYIEIRQKIISQIDSMKNGNQYNVLFAKYVERKTFEKIADEMDYSWRQTIRIHGEAIREFEKMFGSVYMS